MVQFRTRPDNRPISERIETESPLTPMCSAPAGFDSRSTYMESMNCLFQSQVQRERIHLACQVLSCNASSEKKKGRGGL